MVQKGGVITVEAAKEKKKEKEEKEKAAAIRRARKSIQIAVNKAKAALNRHGIATRKAEKDRKKQIRSIEHEGGTILPELLIPVPDPEKNPNTQDLESLEAPPDLAQALLLLEPMSVTPSNVIYPQMLALDGEDGDLQIYTRSQGQVEAGASHMDEDSHDSDSESNSGSSCVSTDLITRNANFVAFN